MAGDKTPKKTLPAPPDPDTGLEVGLMRKRVRERHERASRGKVAVEFALNAAAQTPLPAARRGLWINASTTSSTTLPSGLITTLDRWGPTWTSNTGGLSNYTTATFAPAFIMPTLGYGANMPPPRAYRTAAQLEQERVRQVSADRRARDLLLSCLTEAQRQMLDARGQFLVASSRGRVFSIGNARMHNVHLLGPQQERLEEWCVTVVEAEQVPVADILLAQKLHLETDEDAFRLESNVKCMRTGRMLYRARTQYRAWEAGPYERLLAA